jgi:hypothetical protein
VRSRSILHLAKVLRHLYFHRLDTIGRAAFSYDFDCLSGAPHPLEEALNGLTNCEHKSSSFYMRALFWLFPPMLSIGKKGEMIQKTKFELGVIASRMWWDAKVAGDRESKTLMAHMRKIISQPLHISISSIFQYDEMTLSPILFWTSNT